MDNILYSDYYIQNKIRMRLFNDYTANLCLPKERYVDDDDLLIHSSVYNEIRDKFDHKRHEILTGRSRDIRPHLSIRKVCSSVCPCCSAGAITSSAPSHPS